MRKELAILLTTYNGEKYIHELLDSILLTIDSFDLYIRDDGSTDRTIEIIKKYEWNHKESIKIFYGENVGTSQGFNDLLKISLDDGHTFFMFADQDDKWIDKKIDQMLDYLKAGDDNKPRLVHSNLYVVDENLNVIDESFWRYQHLNPYRTRFNRLLIQNVITGCTVGMNRKLAELVYPIPREAIMHDWWIGLVASAFGVIDVIDEPLVYYRQHNANTIGAQKFAVSMKKINESFMITKYTKQAEAFYEKYYKFLSLDYRRVLEAFVSLSSVNKLKAIELVVKFSFFKNGIIRNIGFIFKLLFQKRM